MTIAVGTHAGNATGGATSVTTAGVTTTSTKFFLVTIMNTSEFSSVADSKGNTYSLVTSRTFVSGGGGQVRVYLCESGTGGASHTWTLNATVSGALTVFGGEVTGAEATALDAAVTASANDTASPFTVTSGTPAQANELILLAFGGDSGSNPATHAESTGFTILDNVTNGSTFYTGFTAYKIISAASAVTPSVTESGGGNTGLIVIGLKQAAGGVADNIVAWITA